MKGNTIYVGDSILRDTTKPINGEIVSVDNESYYRISNYDSMPPFLMNIVSDSDLWMFISSNGALTAGRKNPDTALFPYYPDDRIHDSYDITGSKTVVFVNKENKSYLWEPFSTKYNGLYNSQRNIYKSTSGNKIMFEEINRDLSVVFRYWWLNCDRFGFIKKSSITNMSSESVWFNILDGIQNILPYGVDRKFQLEYSTLLDAYKKNELIEEIGLGLYTLSSIPTDKAEPSEALRATIIWSNGLNNTRRLLSSLQVDSFKMGLPVAQERSVKATRGAYILQSEFELSKGGSKLWYIVADVNKDQSDVIQLSKLLRSSWDVKEQIENEVKLGSTNLNSKIACADGFQLTNDQLITSRHTSNVLFNIMRGGVFDNNYSFDKIDFISFVKAANIPLYEMYSSFFESLPVKLSIEELVLRVENLSDPELEKLCFEYLPLTFGRRHGDPSRPWNLFSIDIKDENGNKVLNYQGNWRDVFQNWEALALSFPEYIENMIVKFANASTADGYNPYKITRDGFDWEVLDPTDPWSYIGYWGDHQVVYLHKLLELSSQYHPGLLKSLLTKEIFAYANVPYKIKPYEEIVANPHSTIDFDFELDDEINKRVKEIGSDGKYLRGNGGKIYRTNFTEKLLVVVLIRLSNFIPEAGIWMNTQRPEWNDANNALVGYGTSMVTLYYLRSFIAFCIKLFKEVESEEQIKISSEIGELFDDIESTFVEFHKLLTDKISDHDRKTILDRLGTAGSKYRSKIYSNSFSEKKEAVKVSKLIMFFYSALDYIDHSIKAGRRDDDLFHSYNLIKIDNCEVKVRQLYEMLEGQVAVLSSGYLSYEDSILLLAALRKSRLYRNDQSSYLLYPERQLPWFVDKNIIPKETLVQSQLLQTMINNDDRRIVVRDVEGKVHFNSKFRNAGVLKKVLAERDNSKIQLNGEEQTILDIYESVFDHQSFTGRSGTFYKYEGLGSIYWHMVSKLLLAVQDTFFNAVESGVSDAVQSKLKDFYYEIKEGIGYHKSPELYGAFPTDPYSHTPSNMGAQQPGMTGQVKEDIITRMKELGVYVKEGKINFYPRLLNEKEFLSKSQVYEYYDLYGKYQTLMLNPGMLAFMVCQIPVIYIKSEEEKVIIVKDDDNESEIEGLSLSSQISMSVFQREGKVIRIKVLINK